MPSLVHYFDLSDGMKLQVKVSGCSKGSNAKLEFQLRNCSNTWVLHWGGVYRGQTKWILPSNYPAGTRNYEQKALQTPFVKVGEVYLIVIELRDPKIHAIEFVLKDDRLNKWLKLNQNNFRIEIPEDVVVPSTSYLSIPKDLVERRAYLLWESKGKPRNSPQQQKEDYDAAYRELQSQFSKGVSLEELRNCSHPAPAKRSVDEKERPVVVSRAPTPNSHRRYDVGQWLNKTSNAQAKANNFAASPFMNLVEKCIGGDNVILRKKFQVGNHEIVILLITVRGDYHLIVASNMKGTLVLHWGISKLSATEWLIPPQALLPERSKLVNGACQSYFKEMSSREGWFQFVDINLRSMDLLGVQFILWSGESWLKDNGSNFFVDLKPTSHKSKQEEGDGKRIVKWLLDEINRRETDAERSLMHRFNIAKELAERCQTEGQLGLIGILVWLRFMACRQLTWNKNYNVKPREISAAQDAFTNLLQRKYSSQPNDREILRLIMSTIGRGGQGDVGQRIRDEILVLQRNNDCKGGMMEEWHQKLHNNSSPDDVIICQALLDYVKSDFKIEVYWNTLKANGITKDRLRSYDRPIVSEPRLRVDTKGGLIRDLTSYLKTLKAVHSGADLESAIDTCLGYSSKGYDFMGGVQVRSIGGLSPKLQECLSFVKLHIEDNNIRLLMEKLLECRIELRPLLLTSHERLKDLIFLDLALDFSVKTTIERGFKELCDAHIPDILFFISLLLENSCLSTVNNEDLIFCTKDWYRICESYKPNDDQWALQAKSVIDRVRLSLTDKAQYYYDMIQPSAEYLGKLLRVEKWAIDIFTEELIRGGSVTCLSMLVNRLDPILRKIGNLGSWQIISAVEVRGFITTVNELISVQNKVYGRRTVLIANKVSGEEEIPDGVVAVLTPDMPDVLSHVSVRARNSKVCFATCFDQSILRALKLKEGKAVSIQVKSTNLVISDISSSDVSLGASVSSSIPRGLTLKKKSFAGKYAVSAEEFTTEMVGAKSRNIQFLRGRVPSWIKIPTSVALPFGVFEKVLASELNTDLAYKVSSLSKSVIGGDLSKLRVIQEAVLQMRAPSQLINELRNKMKSSRMPWPGDEGQERWNKAWQATKKVWASKWNERAYVSCRKANLNHDNLCMAVLVQEVIAADYAFVIHTRNPLTGDTSEIYTEIVKGLGETLVGAYPGRAMGFITRKSDLRSPKILGYPSKKIGLFIRKSLIFRSDSNGEDLEGYAGAGLYDSVPMDKEEEVVLDYSCDKLVTDQGFQRLIFSRIAEAGKIIESLYSSAQDIEGVVKDGEIYVVQTRPQM
ncbi:hypothetical protein MKW92_044526 [Papaver armeniacum]|nr:hypothetical protein MKW92_044526 [Papaver armeniacum]